MSDESTANTPSTIARPREYVCRFCKRAIVMRQMRERVSGTVAIMPCCPRHGTLQPDEMVQIWR